MKLPHTDILADEHAATTIEYGMLIAFLAILIITALTGVGVKLEAIFVAFEGAFAGIVP